MYTLIFLFALPLLALVVYFLIAVFREISREGLQNGFLRRAFYSSDNDKAKSQRDRKSCVMVLLGGLFFFAGYWMALFSLFSGALFLFFIGVAILVIGMIVSLRPILSR